MKAQLRIDIVRFSLATAMVAGIVGAYYKLVRVNPTTAALTLLLAILAIAASWGLRYAVFMSVVATLGLNYFFLPPALTFTIADPQNWVALFVFLASAIIASHLSERARREALNADRRRREVERLYAFSQRLLLTDNIVGLLNAIPAHIVESFGVRAATLFLAETQQVYVSDVTSRELFPIDRLQAVSGRGEPIVDREHGLSFMPLRLGVRSLGTIAVAGVLSPETLEATGSLVAIAIERAGAVERLGKTEAARESERLRTLLLDSVAHEFRTPLTAIKAAAESLLAEPRPAEPQARELLTVINEESDRLNRLVGEAAEMAQLETELVELQLEPGSIREAIDAALEDAKRSLQGHPVQIEAERNLPLVRMDMWRIKEVLVHLLDNAAKYSPAGTPIQVTAEPRDSAMIISVADQGFGIDDLEQGMVFDKFYRGQGHRYSVQGTGMGLSIAKAIVEAHRGTMGVTSQLGHGSVFYFSLPLAETPTPVSG